MRLGWWSFLIACGLTLNVAPAAADKLTAVATFSILADLTQRIGGDHIQVQSLVGPNGDAHVFEPGPKESEELARATVLVANGLGFEPWLQSVQQASGFKGKVIIASEGVAALKGNEELGPTDPHAFQDVRNAETYAANIAKGLSEADPTHAVDFK